MHSLSNTYGAEIFVGPLLFSQLRYIEGKNGNELGVNKLWS